ncbi:hypothetical protein Tco_1382607 [Tanacetum coccineum]
MFEMSMYNSWQSRMLFYIKATRPKTYAELSEAEKLQDDFDLCAMNIVLQGLSPNIYALVNHNKNAKEI